MTDQLKQLSEAATGGVWHCGHFVNPELKCGCRYIFAGDYMGAFAQVYEGETEGDNPPESQQIANALLTCALVNTYRAGELVPAEELEEAQLAEDGAMQIIAAERAKVLALEAQLTEVKAREAVAYEVAAKYVQSMPTKYQPQGDDELLHRMVTHSEMAEHIRALTPDHTTTALEQIKQEAREPFKKLADDMADILDRMSSEHCLEDAYSMAIDALDLHTEQSAAILATLSEQKENSDEPRVR